MVEYGVGCVCVCGGGIHPPPIFQWVLSPVQGSWVSIRFYVIQAGVKLYFHPVTRKKMSMSNGALEH